jgi:hypothetical protein
MNHSPLAETSKASDDMAMGVGVPERDWGCIVESRDAASSAVSGMLLSALIATSVLVVLIAWYCWQQLSSAAALTMTTSGKLFESLIFPINSIRYP